MFTSVLDLFWKDTIKGLSPVEVYSFLEVEKAFRRMQTGGHMSKLVRIADTDAIVKMSCLFLVIILYHDLILFLDYST